MYKKIFPILFFLLTISSTFMSFTMEKPITELPVVIENRTGNKITISYQMKKDPQATRAVIADGQKYSISDLKSLVALSVAPYGYYRGWLSKETLSWFIKPENLAQKVEAKSLEFGNKPILVTVTLRGWFGGVRSYVYEYKPFIEETREKRKLYSVFDRFRLLKNALENKAKPEARYVLGVGLNATPHDINVAYQKLVQEYRKMLSSEDLEEKLLAGDALKFINAAYKSLTEGGEATKEFERMVADEEAEGSVYYLKASQ